MFNIKKHKMVFIDDVGEGRVTSGRWGRLVEAAVVFTRFLGAIDTEEHRECKQRSQSTLEALKHSKGIVSP